MKNYIFNILTILFAMAFAFSCSKVDSNDLDPKVPFYQDYKVVYKKHENTTKAKATFRVKNSSGVRIELESPASILCNDRSSSFSNIENYFYHWNFDGIADVSFKLTDNKSRVFNNQILFSEVLDIDFPESFNIVMLDGTTTFSWIGEPLMEGEFIYGVIVQNEFYSQQFFVDEPGTTSFILPANYMNDLSPGTAKFQIFRESHINTVEEEDLDAGGRRITIVETVKTVTLK